MDATTTPRPIIHALYRLGRWLGRSQVFCASDGLLDELELRLVAAGGRVHERVPRALEGSPSVLVHDLVAELAPILYGTEEHPDDFDDRDVALARGGASGAWLPWCPADERERLLLVDADEKEAR